MPKAHALVDNFNNNAIDPLLWTGYANPSAAERVREINGRLEMRPRSGDSGNFSGYQSNALYDLTDSYVHVELVRTLRAAAGADTSFSVEMNANNSLFFSVQDGDLRCQQNVASVFTLLKRVLYDPVAHRWLRLREETGTSFWEVSADGTQWNVLFSRPDPFSLVSVTVRLQIGLSQPVVSPGMAIFDNLNVIDTARSRRVEERRRSARDVRSEAAELALRELHPEHVSNDDEADYVGNLWGNYSKRLRHDSLGDPEPESYGTLLRALQSEEPDDFEKIQLFETNLFPLVKLTNPQAGLAFENGGPDAQEITMPPAPRFDSEQTAHEMGELYWMALARDIPFRDWPAQAGTAGSPIREGINSLNNEFAAYGGPRSVTVQNLFRGIYPGEQVGPYVSQFLLKGNVDQRKPAGQGRDATDGFVSYGAQTIDQRITPAQAGLDYLTTFSTWLDAQNGRDTRGQDSFLSTRRFITTLRDGATYVHFDQVLNPFYNAAWILMSEPEGNQSTFLGGANPPRPQIDLEFPKDQGNPYDPPGTILDSKTQSGFATFGPIQLLQVLGEVLGRALRAVWWQKWGVHRRLRPEEYGGRVHNHITGAREYPLHPNIVTSLQSGALAPFFGNAGETFPGSWLLPQAYPEGAPTHPAYGAGHATGSAACATILKAFFDESKSIENPVQANASGSLLVSYTGADATQMTVGGELNKLAGNIALFRNAAGVHWRSDYTESFPLGEAIAIRLLQEMSLGFNEDDAFFELTRFDSQKIRIFDGKVVPVE